MDNDDSIDNLSDHIDALEQSLGQAGGMAKAFDSELRQMSGSFADAGREVNVLSRGISRGLRRSFDGLVFDGMKLSDALSGVAESMANAAYSAAIRPVTNRLGGLLASGVEGIVQGFLPFAQGGGFAQGRVMPFAQGGIVSGPVQFPMRGGMGLMGEAGPEAIMPLSRGADGRLGIRAEGGGRAINVVMNVHTPDAESFRRSNTQIAAQLSRAIGRGQRNR